MATDRQRLFASEYLKDLNAGAAAIRAGYSEKFARTRGHHLLQLPAVAKMIEDAMKARVERLEIDADRVVAELAKIAFANMADYLSIKADGKDKGQATIDLSKLSRDQFAAIGEITIEDIETGRRTGKRTRFKLLDKRQALVDLGKHLGLFVEKAKVEHSISVAELEDASQRLEDRLLSFAAGGGAKEDPRLLQ